MTVTPDYSNANMGLGPILQDQLREPPWMAARARRLPGVEPLNMDDWPRVDEAFAAQMALRKILITEQNDKVRAALPGSEAAAAELFDFVLATLAISDDYAISQDQVTRPDGVKVSADGDPLTVLGHLVVEDFNILQRAPVDNRHRLTAAILCFPFQWSLAEKLGRPLTDVHRVVASYQGDVAARVQRLFDGLRPGMGLCRTNGVTAQGVELFTPRLEAERPPTRPKADVAPFIRSERQCLLRLPKTGAVVFSIQTLLVRHSSLSDDEAAMLAQYPIHREAG